MMLPDGSGYDVCRAVKEKGNYPVIFLTAYDDEVNVVMGLEIGADDYISKPFRLKELMARIKSVMRRYAQDQTETVTRVGELIINTSSAKVFMTKPYSSRISHAISRFISLSSTRRSFLPV